MQVLRFCDNAVENATLLVCDCVFGQVVPYMKDQSALIFWVKQLKNVYLTP